MTQEKRDKRIARIIFLEMEEVLEKLQYRFPEDEIDFCWDECLWVNESFFSGGLSSVSDEEEEL